MANLSRLHNRFSVQRPMIRVCAALLPLLGASVYYFGWRALALSLFCTALALLTEAAFALPRAEPVTSAVLVTALIFSLSLPPRVPFWMAGVGILFAVAFGKMVFGGFGRNVFNPAMAGRCFLYVTFPVQMTGQWQTPLGGGWGGLTHWWGELDAVTRATPLAGLDTGHAFSLGQLFLGRSPGSLGETSALLILIGGAYLVFKKTAPWRLALSCLVGGAGAILVLQVLGGGGGTGLPENLLAGSFLFGTTFVVTEPVSGPKTPPAQWIYGASAGALTMILRRYSNFAEGVMFSVLLMNAFAPLLDEAVRRAKGTFRTREASEENPVSAG